MDKKLVGRFGEQSAAEYLKKKHYNIIGLNYSCRFGEIDVIAANKKYIVLLMSSSASPMLLPKQRNL